jgi:hypothetical protein
LFFLFLLLVSALVLSFDKGDTSPQSAAAITQAMETALSTGTLCDQLEIRAAAHGLIFMATPQGAISLRAICSQPKISLISSNLSLLNYPTASKKDRKGRFQLLTLTSGATSLLIAIAAIAFLRFLASCCLVRLERGEEREGGHLYDVLVKLTNGQEVVLEDIHHEDIVFYRTHDTHGATEWTMNATPHILLYQYTVQFFDIDNLLNLSRLDKDSEVTTMEASREFREKPSQVKLISSETEMKIGIIVNVKAGSQSKKLREYQRITFTITTLVVEPP